MKTAHVPEMDASPLEPIFDGVEPRTNLLELPAGERVSEHRHPGRRIVFYVIEGTITLRVGDETRTLGAGDVAHLDGERTISPVAESDSRALVVLSSADES